MQATETITGLIAFGLISCSGFALNNFLHCKTACAEQQRPIAIHAADTKRQTSARTAGVVEVAYEESAVDRWLTFRDALLHQPVAAPESNRSSSNRSDHGYHLMHLEGDTGQKVRFASATEIQ